MVPYPAPKCQNRPFKPRRTLRIMLLKGIMSEDITLFIDELNRKEACQNPLTTGIPSVPLWCSPYPAPYAGFSAFRLILASRCSSSARRAR